MLAEERFGKILELVNRKGAVTVAELCKAMQVSEATVRRDLGTLAEQGRLAKVHGGAIALENHFAPEEPDVSTKEALFVNEKEQIARYAAQQVNDDDVVFLDAGTTVLRMVEHLGESKATFITTGITCAGSLVKKGLRAYVIGGLLKPGTEAIVGGAALEALSRYNFTKAFIGTNGITTRQGYTTPDTEEARIKSKVVEQAYLSYFLADSSKFGKVAAVTICPLEKGVIITDRLPDQSFKKYAVIKEVNA